MHLLHSQYDFAYVLRLPLKTMTRLLVDAVKKREKDKAWQMWLQIYPDMVIPRRKVVSQREVKWVPFISQFVPFTQFYNTAISKPDTRTKEEILQDVEEIRKMVRLSKR